MVVVANNEGKGLAPYLEVPLVHKDDSLVGICSPANNIPIGAPVVFCGNSYGSDAAALSSTNPVYGSSIYTDKINSSLGDRLELALNIGISIPKYKKFDSSEERDLYLYDNPHWEAMYGQYALQREQGVPITVEAFYEHGKFRNYFCKIQGDRLLANNKGAFAPSSCTCTFSQPNVPTRFIFKNLAQHLMTHAPYFKGPVTIETISHENKHWYRKLNFGYDFDHEFAKVALCSERNSEKGRHIVLGEGEIPKGFATTIRMYDVFKQGYYLDRVAKIDRRFIVPIDCTIDNDRLKSCGLVPLVCIGLGKTIIESFQNAYEVVRSIGIKDLCYRPDGENYTVDWWKRAKRVGLI
jgi:hypothetical protein